MDLSKLKSFKIVNRESAKKSKEIDYSKRNNKYKFAGSDLFPVSSEMEKLYETQYDETFPIGKFSVDFLLNEFKGQDRNLMSLIKENFPPFFDNNGWQLEDLESYMKFNNTKNYYTNNIKRENSLAFFFVLNEFLNQDEIDFYGDFIEQKFDEIYDKKYMNFDLQPNDYTGHIFDSLIRGNDDEKHIFSLTTLSEKKTEDHLALLKTVTKEEIETVFDDEYLMSFVIYEGYNKSAITHLKNILDYVRRKISDVKSESIERKHNISEKDMIAEAFTYLLHKEMETISWKKMKNYSEILFSIEKYIIDETVYSSNLSTSRNVTPQTIRVIVEPIYENMDNISLQDFVVFLGSIFKTRSFSSSGSFLSFINLFEEIIQENGFEKFWNIVKLLNDIVLYHDGSLPSYSEWKDEIIDKEQIDINHSLLIPLVVKDYSDSRKLLDDLLLFRERILNN